MAKTPVKKITDLPIELQKTIFSHSSTYDLTNLAVVSKHFHSIASAQLYRSFCIVFPDDDDPFESPIDALASGLDTLVASEYDYAKHLKEMALDSYSGGDRGERVYKAYSYDLSCGKFMSTLLHLTLRKARALEKFYWNIRVELSRPVFKELHGISSLQELHVRLQAGPSIYRPPEPFNENATPANPPLTSTASHNVSTSPAAISVQPPPTLQNAMSRSKSSSKRPQARQPPTFSGFKDLTSLAVLDIDSLDYIPEIASCIRSCSSTLRKLKLSLAESTAMRARKPTTVDDSDESDIENDEFDNPLVQPPPILILSTMPETPQEKEAKSRAERTVQEAILGRLFGIEKEPVTNRKDDKKDVNGNAESTPSKPNAQELRTHKDSLENVVMAITTLLAASERCLVEDLQKDVPAWTKIQEIAQRMVKMSGTKSVGSVDSGNPAAATGSTEATGSKETPADKEPEKSVEATPKDTGDSTTKNATTEDSSKKNTENSANVDESSDQQPKPAPAKSGSMRPEDIDIEHPDDVEDEDGEQQEFVDEASNEVEDIVKVPVAVEVEVNTSNPVIGNMGDPQSSKHHPEDPSTVVGNSKEDPEAASSKDSMKEYIRSTRKLALRSFSLYLIPIKASIIHRAIDLHVLHRITLLNVGPQAPLWRQMLVMQRSSPLNLECVSTDDVSIDFLVFARELKTLKEAYLLERNRNSKVVSGDELQPVGIESIRKYLLKKHMKSLKRLMIKNENDYRWDINDKTMSLITKKGGNLTELAINLGLRSFHLLLQYFPGLANLRALHILNFRTDDTCTWVMRELRKFAMDNVAHHPDMKLEYIALEGTVEALVRKTTEKKAGKQQRSGPAGKSGGENPGTSTTDEIGSSDDDSDDTESSPSLKVETIEGLEFYDPEDIRIFRKDVRVGRL
ncbi:MAG: hypothetical protein M1816_007885 [Peltula sp. TS41687]|nr:MAG: hypothetical protein M1816_007885 [Peltula sp. TS41687]